MKELNMKLEELNCKKEDMERRKQIEVCSDKEWKKEVEYWLRSVESINKEIQDLELKYQNVSFLTRRDLLGRLVQDKILQLYKIFEKGSFPDGIVITYNKQSL